MLECAQICCCNVHHSLLIRWTTLRFVYRQQHWRILSFFIAIHYYHWSGVLLIIAAILVIIICKQRRKLSTIDEGHSLENISHRTTTTSHYNAIPAPNNLDYVLLNSVPSETINSGSGSGSGGGEYSSVTLAPKNYTEMEMKL